jgi:hypothetical protein
VRHEHHLGTKASTKESTNDGKEDEEEDGGVVLRSGNITTAREKGLTRRKISASNVERGARSGEESWSNCSPAAGASD